nr:hypothetical protein [Tanacetum cinerariifolium]
MEQPNPTFAKIPILDTEFGDSYESPQEESGTGSASKSSAKKKGRTVVVTTEDMQKRRNDVKARTTLLLAFPDEHQLRFSKYKTAQELWGAILKTFSGNEATKKTKKNQLKQRYGNFKAKGSETLEQTFNRLQAIKKTGKKITIQGTDVDGFDKSKVEFFNCHKMGHFARECRAPRSQDKGRRENYKQGSKIEELAPKALMAINEVGWDWSYMANEEENHALVADEEAPIEFALMAKSSSSSKNEVFDNSLCSKSCKKNTDSLNTKITNLTEALSDSKTNLYHYKLGLSQVDARLVEFKTQEIKFYEKIKGLEFDLKNKNTKIENLMNELKQIKKKKEGLDIKLTFFEYASKDLDTLLRSQRSDKNKEGLGYSAVPPPLAQVYSPPKKDMSWTGLLEFADDTITDYSRPSSSIESNSSDLQNSNSSIFKHGESSESIMSKPMIKFMKAADRSIEIKTNKVETIRKPSIKYAEMYRNTHKSPKVRASVSAVRRVNTAVPRPNVNSARPKTTQDLVIIKLIQRVKRLERELKARTSPTKIQKGNSETKLEDSMRLNKEVVDYILQVKIKLLIKKLEDSDAEHQV